MSQKTILITEDSSDDELFLRQLLDDAGFTHRVLVVRDAEETVSYLSGLGTYADRGQFPIPDVLLLDLKLPKMNGLQVLDWMKTQPALGNIFVAVITGSDRSEHMRRAYQSGARAFITKPCTAAQLKQLAIAYPQYWSSSAPSTES